MQNNHDPFTRRYSGCHVRACRARTVYAHSFLPVCPWQLSSLPYLFEFKINVLKSKKNDAIKICFEFFTGVLAK